MSNGLMPTGEVAEQSPYMTTAEVATLARTPAETLRYWRQLKKGPRSFKVGRRVLYARSDVEAWIDAARDEVPA